MKISSTGIKGVAVLHPPKYDDERGCFRPVFAERLHAGLDEPGVWAEMNFSHTRPGTIRGLHFQHPGAQAKLITVVEGNIFDVVVDLRRDSPSFGKFESFELSADDPELPSQIYLPKGMAHGFATTETAACVAYLVSTPWNPETEQVLQWNDPSLNIPWPIANPNLSGRDQRGLPLGSLDL